MKSSNKVPAITEFLPQIRDWFHSDLGQQLLKQEQSVVDELMEGVFGYHLLQVGLLADQPLYSESTASHKFMMLTQPLAADDQTSDESLLVGSAEELPLASECIDAVVLHHALDFAESPHQVLREASRVLRPGGKLIVVGFNPMSFWGFYRAMVKRRKPVPWRSWFISQRRLNDWFTLLELKQEQHEGGFYRPPFASERWMNKFGWLEKLGNKYLNHSGGFYVFLATKETFSVTPLNLGWRRRLAMPLMTGSAKQAGRSVANGKMGVRNRLQKQQNDNSFQRGVVYPFPIPHSPKAQD